MCCCSKDALKGEWRRANSHTRDCNVLASLTRPAVCLAVLEPGTFHYGVMERYGTMDWSRKNERTTAAVNEWVDPMSYANQTVCRTFKVGSRFPYFLPDWAEGGYSGYPQALTWITSLIWKNWILLFMLLTAVNIVLLWIMCPIFQVVEIYF